MADINKIKVGQQVVLTIGTTDRIEGDYFGNVCGINKERTLVHLKDVIFGSTKRVLSGVKRFYSPEILAIKIIADVPDDDSLNEQPTETTLDDLKFELSVREEQIIRSRIKNLCMIETAGEEYDSAVQDISHYYFVALTAAIGYGESGFVVCSTSQKIYVFNIRAIGAINGQFKEWFESDTHTKVVHGANNLEENLFHCHGICVRGVFDTMAARRRIQQHIEMPSELEDKLDTRKISTLISRTAVLLKFHEFLTEHLLKNAYQSFQLNVDYCRNKSFLDVQSIYRDGKSIVSQIPPFQRIDVNAVGEHRRSRHS